ncbi:ABC transporter permease [soil metagenome]
MSRMETDPIDRTVAAEDQPPTDRPPAGLERRRRKRLTSIFQSAGTSLGLLGLIAVFGILRPDAFLTATNFRNVLEQCAILAIVATTQTVVMIVNDFDLSVGSVASLAGCVTAALLVDGVPIVAAVIAGLLAGVAAGAVNGLLIGYLGLSAFVATLAMMTTVSGIAFTVVNGSTIFGLPDGFLVIGGEKVGALPIPVLIAAVVAIVFTGVASLTSFGRRLHAVGGNAEVARLSGISVSQTRFFAFVISGLGAAIAGIVLVSRVTTAAADGGSSLMLQSIAAVFLGMTMFKGGVPNVPGTIVGVGILGVMSNGLNILEVSPFVQMMATGVIIVLAVALSKFASKSRA